MARTVDQVMHAQRREQFVDAAQRLIQSKGYQQMSIVDVLDELGASRGAFYHYFNSKQALLEAVIDRTAQTIAAALTPVAATPELSAPEKLSRFFAALAGWKIRQRVLLLPLLRVWQSDDNAIVRQKIRPSIANRYAPPLTEIVEQGVGEGVFTVIYPARCARVIISLTQDLNDELAELFLATRINENEWQVIEQTVAAYTDAVERILGAPTGSVTLVDPRLLRSWFDPVDDENKES
ncbi:MAG: TetR/AcrR family transcriptional regulator [Mycobacterium sp.]